MSQPDQDDLASTKQHSPQETKREQSLQIKRESSDCFITQSTSKYEPIIIHDDSDVEVEMANVTQRPDTVVDSVEAAVPEKHREEPRGDFGLANTKVAAGGTIDMTTSAERPAKAQALIPIRSNLVPSPAERALQNQQDEEALVEASRAVVAAFRAELQNNAAPTLGSSLAAGSLSAPISFPSQRPFEHHDFDKQADAIADAEAAAAFEEMKRQYKRKAKKNQATLQDEVEFKRAEAAETRRQKVLQKKRAYRSPEERQQAQDDDEPMFFSDDERPTMVPARMLHEDTRNEHPSDERRAKKAKQAEKYHVPPALRQSMQIGLDAGRAKAQKEAKKKNRNVSEKRKAPKERISKSKEKNGNGANKKKGRRPLKGLDLANVGSLLNNDIIAHAIANQGKAAQPGFSSTRRKDALTELVASMPAGHRNLYAGDKKALEDSCKKFSWKGPGSMHSDGKGGWLLKGMKTSLFHYQLLGAAWMRERENSATAPFGGIVADSMGFGKTVQMLANMVEGRPTDTARNKTTLIIVPASLTSQWLDQIRMHVQPGVLGEVMLYRSGARVISEDAVKTLGRCGVIITTYHEILSQYPKFKPPKYLSSKEEIDSWWEKHFEGTKGPFFRLVLQRIILDEAQIFKNHESSTSIAVRALRGKYRWTITGTPIQNTVEEFYPYFDFLKVSNSGTLDCFRSNFGSKSERTMSRLHAVLQSIMLRRTGQDTLFDRPIVKLPALDHETEYLDWQNDTEKAIYNIIRRRFHARVQSWVLGGEIERQYRVIFVMFLRLRQICGHILLAQATIQDLLEAEDIEKLWRMTEREVRPAEDGSSPNTMSVLKSMLEKQKSKNQASADQAERCVTNAAEGTDGGSYLGDTGGSLEHPFKFRKYLRQLRDSGSWEEINARSMCHKCHQVPEDPHITIPCEHMYCKECLTLIMYEAGKNERDRALCIECGLEFEKSEPCRGFDEAAFNIDNPGPSFKGRRSKGSTEVEANDLDWLSLPGPPPLSAKTAAVRAFLLRWLAEGNGVKCIVFTQFLGMIKILGRICVHEGWDYCTFTGVMSLEARDRAIAEFRDDPEKRILLATLKAGGLGLNLTRQVPFHGHPCCVLTRL